MARLSEEEYAEKLEHAREWEASHYFADILHLALLDAHERAEALAAELAELREWKAENEKAADLGNRACNFLADVAPPGVPDTLIDKTAWAIARAEAAEARVRELEAEVAALKAPPERRGYPWD